MGRVETLILLKHDLGIHTNAHDEYLRFLLKSAKERISREGIKEEDTTEYTAIQIEYAAYLFQKRAGTDTAMPRFLRWDLNNLLISQKAKKEKTDDV